MKVGAERREATSRGGARTITLVRHGKPALSRKIVLNAAEYRAWWSRYEAGGLAPGQGPAAVLIEAASAVGGFYCSVRRRAVESAAMISKDFVAMEVFVEAPLPPPHLPKWLRLSPVVWGTVARFIWWNFNFSDGQESKAAAQERASLAVQFLDEASSERDLLVVGHGFFNAMIGLELRRSGWRLTKHGGFGYWSRQQFQKPE